MIQRADSKRSGAGSTAPSAVVGNGTRHRRLPSSRFKHAKVGGWPLSLSVRVRVCVGVFCVCVCLRARGWMDGGG